MVLLGGLHHFLAANILRQISWQLFLTFLPLMPAALTAASATIPKWSIVPQLIDLPGTYKVEIPLDTFQSDPAYLEAYMNGEDVVFSRLFSSRVDRIVIGPSVNKQGTFRIWSYAASKDAIGPQPTDTDDEWVLLGRLEGRLVYGMRGPYCSLEIAGESREGNLDLPFQEYYLVLALGLKDEQSLWLGAANTPPDGPQGKFIRFILTNTASSSMPASTKTGCESPDPGPPQSR